MSLIILSNHLLASFKMISARKSEEFLSKFIEMSFNMLYPIILNCNILNIIEGFWGFGGASFVVKTGHLLYC